MKQEVFSRKNFRLMEKKKYLLKTKANENEESISSEERSQFSKQYNLLTKKMKLKSNSYFVNKRLASTISNIYDKSSIYLKTESDFSKNSNQKISKNIFFLPTNFNKKYQLNQCFSWRFDRNCQRKTMKLNADSYSKNKKYYKIQKPSLYCQFQQEYQKNYHVQHPKNIKIQEEEIKVNTNNIKQKDKILQNWVLLWKIRKQLTQNSNNIKPKDVIKAIKLYIMRKDELDESNNGLQKLMSSPENQYLLKQLLVYERFMVIGIVELLRLQKLHFLCIQYVNILNNLMGLYKHILILLFTSPQPSITIFLEQLIPPPQYNNLIQQISRERIQQKSSLNSTLILMYTKLHTIYRLSPELLKRIKEVARNSKNVSLNRSFYQLLTTFAVYLNNKQMEISANSQIIKYLSSFMTCPSPYILQPRENKNYSLVLDLDETLVNTKFDNSTDKSQYCIGYRPYCQEFIEHLSQLYEIIIFTSSVSSYAQEVITKFQSHVSHILCRQHIIKAKGQTIKDLSKIGRPIESIIIIDNISHNFKLQRQNGIEIVSWYGDRKDRELQKIEKLLIKVIEDNPKDVREALKKLLA